MNEQEVVIVGYTAPQRSRKYFGALVLAVRTDSSWRYVGRAGTGFDEAMLRSLYEKMQPLKTQAKPLNVQVKGEAHTTWLRPRLVGEVKFTEWTTSGEIRHPVFLGIRSDKKAADVIAKCRHESPITCQGNDAVFVRLGRHRQIDLQGLLRYVSIRLSRLEPPITRVGRHIRGQQISG
jgi:ATP-dependent DNA ligase